MELSRFVHESDLEFQDNDVISTLSYQVGGNHYKEYEIQPIEFILANKIPYVEGNIIKYICRYKEKNGIEDLRKAKHYIDILIKESLGEKNDN